MATTRSKIIKQLLEAHAEGDSASFRKAALQLAAAESKAGHVRVAKEIRKVIQEMPTTPPPGLVVDIARPRGELAEVLEGGYRKETFSSIVLPGEAQEQLERVLRENRSRNSLEQWGVAPRRRLLFHGPPGCGKTLASAVLAGEIGLPLLTVRFDALFSRFLGATANHLRTIFSEMPRRPAVYLFDEFDALGKTRGDQQDVGEMNRIVTAFLQLIDSDRSTSIIIAATNFSRLLDHAVFRRFDLILPFDPPGREQVEQVFALRLCAFDLPESLFPSLADQSEGMSYADIASVCDDAIRNMALDGRKQLSAQDVESAFQHACLSRTTNRSV